MITPAQQHWQNVMAQRAGRANEGVDHAARTAHEEVLYRLRLAQARLKGVQARSAKAAIKKELLPDFSGWIEGTLEADGGQQDEVIATLMVWAIDCGDLPLALRIGAYVVRHNLIMPELWPYCCHSADRRNLQPGTDAGRGGCRRGFVRLYRTTGHPPEDCHRPGHAGRSTRQIMQGVRLCPSWSDRCRQHGLITEAAARTMHLNPKRRCETRDCNPFPRPEKSRFRSRIRRRQRTAGAGRKQQK
ncbi:Phage terminase, endonuclease small subunit M [Escherichia coli]|nr:Phage terminase, endonuclease small subunit M [Escherichia coli]